MKRIVLLSGKARSGKDSTAIFLKQKLDGSTLIIHNADYLKYMCMQYLGWDGSRNETSRKLLQELGTDKIRATRPMFWIERTCDVIDILQDKYDYFVVADTRFKNEIWYPKARFPTPGLVTTVRITRTDYESDLTPEQKNHYSEIDLDNFEHDYYVYSKSGLNNLEIEVNRIVDFLK